MAYWLFKSEPDTFSIDDLINRPKQTEPWDGVRNYQARNMLRHQVRVGDLGFFYHSSCAVPGIAGVFKVVKAGYPDDSALEPTSPFYDPKSTPDNPRWYRVDVQFVKKFPEIISLSLLKQNPLLKNMLVTQRGNRLSITPVAPLEWDAILKSTPPA